MLKLRLAQLSLISLSLGLLACSHGFHRETLRSELENQTSYQVQVKQERGPVTAEQIEAARALKPQLRYPFSLAVYDAGGCGATAGEREEFLRTADALKQRGAVSNIFFISSLVVKGNDVASARLAAAKHGADALFYYRCVDDEDRYVNPLSVFYLTGLGYWIFPGHSIDVLTMYQGALWDVGNEYLYASTEAEAEANTWGPGATIDGRSARDRAKKNALKQFAKEFVEQVSLLR